MLDPVGISIILPNPVKSSFILLDPVRSSFILSSVAELILFGHSRSRCKGPAPGSGSGSNSNLDKTNEILNDNLSVSSNIDKRL